MSPLQLLGELILFWLRWIGFFYKVAAVIFPLFGALHIMFIVFNDEFLSQHIVLTLILTALFGFTCCLLTLSRICVLQRKPHAANKTVDQLWDTDLKIKNETEEVPYYVLSWHCKDIGTTLKNLIFKNPFEFCKFRPAYGMFLMTGFGFLLVFIAALRQAKERTTKDDFYAVAVELIFPMMLLISLVYLIANTGFYIAKKDYDVYTPFEQFVQVPMKVLAGKTVAIFLTGGGTYWLLVFFFISITALSIVSSNYLYNSSVMGILKCLLPPIFPNPLRFLRTVLIITCVVFVNALVGMIVSAFTEAKKFILDVIEKNWQRNLRAIAFLLEDTEAETLQDLKTALDNKISMPLTEDEETALNYIIWPIWQTKAPFMLRKFERESPDPDIFDEIDNNHEPGNIQQSDITEHKESKDAEQPQEMSSCAQPSISSRYQQSRLDEPSTSSASF